MSLDVDNTELYLKDESKVDTDLTLLDDIIAPSDDNIPDIGKLAYHGILSGSVSYHGNSPEMLRRCLDLSILRSDIKTGRWCVLELDRFKEVGGELAENGWRVGNIDATIVAEKPKLREFIDQMREKISRTLSINTTKVSVKASTSNDLGLVGRGEGMAALAVAVIEGIPGD